MTRPGFRITKLEDAETDVILLDPDPTTGDDLAETLALLDDVYTELRAARNAVERYRGEAETARAELVAARVKIAELQSMTSPAA